MTFAISVAIRSFMPSRCTVSSTKAASKARERMRADTKPGISRRSVARLQSRLKKTNFLFAQKAKDTEAHQARIFTARISTP